MNHRPALPHPAPLAFIGGGGEMGKLVRAMDWSKTPLGPIECWPQSLRTTVGLCLSSNFPISIAWGPKRIQIYNDGYWPICGGKHPHSMGQDFSECWASAWSVIGDAFARAFAGDASYLENQRMFLDRNGYLEETFFTFSFSPIPDESGAVGGVFHPVIETTSQMLAERRARALRDLSARIEKARSLDEAFTASARTLAGYALDLPMVLLYALDPETETVRLVAGTGLALNGRASPARMTADAAGCPWPWQDVARSGRPLRLDDFPRRLGSMSCGPYSEPPRTALLLPITTPGAIRPAGILILGVSARLPFDEVYQSFCDQIAATVASAVANAAAHETETRRAQAAAARENEERLRWALEAANRGAWELDLQSGTAWWSDEMFALWGVEPGTPLRIEDTLAQIDPRDRARVCREIDEAVSQRREYFCEYRILHPVLGERWTSNRGRTVLDDTGTPVRLVGLSFDITEQRRSEEMLRASEERFRAFFHTAAVGTAELALDGRFLKVNDRLCQITGFSRDELLQMTPSQLAHPDEQPGDEKLLSDYLKGAFNNYQVEKRYVRKDGNVIWVQVAVAMVRDANGNPLHSAGVIQDITERKQAENALKAAVEEAKQANAAKSRFLAAASHDLRQPLSALSLYVQTLKAYVMPSGLTMVENMKDCIASLSELLSKLLDLSKLDAGVVNPIPGIFSLDDELTHLVSVYGPEAALKGLRLLCRPTDGMVCTDRILFRRLLSNLIENAIRYTQRGGVLVGYRRKAGKTWVEVWDTGTGIPQDKMGEIFEEFRQLGDDSRTRGSGLGLAIVDRTAALLGLEIRVHSHPGRGSMFAIQAPPPVNDRQAPPPAVVQRGIMRRLHIALVEDNDAVREALALALETGGHRVVSAATGGELLDRLGGQVPDILVSDFRLPKGETGLDVIASTRNFLAVEIPAILVTGDTDPKLVRRMADRGIVVLHKPVDIDDLAACLEYLAM